MTEATMVEVVRDIFDVGLRIRATIPSTWSEIEVADTVLVVGGRLEDNDQTMVPSVQVRLERAASAEDAAAAVRQVAGLLRDAVVIFERSGTGATGNPETVAEIAHLSDATGATQISMFRTIYFDVHHLAVSIIATCGGGAAEAARRALRDIVTSVRVEALPESANA